jgi:hypothetical protein
MKKSGAIDDATASARISERITGLGDWRGETLGRMRSLIREADPDVVEQWKWGVPVWSHDGILCALTPRSTRTRGKRAPPAHRAPVSDSESDDPAAVERELQQAANALRRLRGKSPIDYLAPEQLPATAEPPLCSFCGKGRNQVRSMIAVATAHICSECIILCHDILTSDAPPHA